MINAESFWDRVADKYAAQPIGDENSYQATLERTRNHLGKDDEVLELGCGTGSTAILLAGNTGRITATDISKRMTEIGNEKAKEQSISNIEFVQADVLTSLETDKQYDSILAHNLLHLLEDLPSTLTRIHERLKPGGLFISKTICKPGRGAELKYYLMGIIIPVMQLFGKAPYVKIRSVTEFERMITDVGFMIVESGNFPDTSPSRYIVARKA